jgi:hypothetical protein
MRSAGCSPGASRRLKAVPAEADPAPEAKIRKIPGRRTGWDAPGWNFGYFRVNISLIKSFTLCSKVLFLNNLP